ncbi:MAG TPA: transglycosylase SLT domain-containing protein [Candidatus Dormibacteraeota bacterium]|nr:transglycosylase SLT domain-containing protein [Candidatus Dormibacteraeota bacterium]
MPKLPRLAVAIAAAASLTVAFAAQPAYAAHKRTPAARPVHGAAHAPAPLTPAQTRDVLVRAARHHGLNPNFVLAVSYWESGWKQTARSRTGAIGLMQIEPYTAAWAGPALLHRPADLTNPVDNAELGAALLRSYLDQLHDPKLALGAYYQGLSGVLRHGIYPSSRTYVDGIWKIRNHFQAMHLAS